MLADPPKPIHLAAKVAPDGSVSAACYRKPRPIDLTKASWTLRPEAMTCPKCKEAIRGKLA